MNIETDFYHDELTVERPEGLYGMEVSWVMDCEWTLEDVSRYCECPGRECNHKRMEAVLEELELVAFKPKSVWFAPRLPNGDLCDDTVNIPVHSVVGPVLLDFHRAAHEYAEDDPGTPPTEHDFMDADFNPSDYTERNDL